MALLQKTDKWMMKASIADVKNVLIEALARPEALRASESDDASQQEMLRYLSNLCEIGEGNEWLHADNEKWMDVCEEAYDECSSFKLALLLAVDYKMAAEQAEKAEVDLEECDVEEDADEEDNDNGRACGRCGTTTCPSDNQFSVRLLWVSNKTGKEICRCCVAVEDEED